ncbi:MAG: hypothetical protein ACLGG7_12010 [Bacteriovoracia bacterium]
MRTLLLTLILISTQALALPALEGIAKFSNCSGALVIFEGMPTTARALIVTNAKCLTGRLPRPNAVLSNRLTLRSVSLFDASGKAHAFTARRLLYATLTQTDLALYELAESYNDVQFKTSVRPFFVSVAPPVVGQDLEFISAFGPKRWSCQVQGFVRELRDERWRFSDVIRLTEDCAVEDSPRGMPAVDLPTRTLFALQGPRGFAQQVAALGSCFNEKFEMDLELNGCELPK